VEIAPFVRWILEGLRGAGHEAFIVGGAVRDVLLHRSPSDWDVATSAPPEAIRSLFRDVPSFSLKHGTVTLVHSGEHFEVSTYRGSEDFGKSIDEDLEHRDFTINGMAYDALKGEILDPCGGSADIQRKLVKAVGDPKERFHEDPLRLLRAVRIAAELNFRIEKRTMGEISRMAGFISLAAEERIRDELIKLLMCRKPSQGLYHMVRAGLLGEIMPELLEGYRKKQNELHRFTIFRHITETVDRVRPEPVLRLTALLHDIAKPRVRQKKDGRFRFIGHERASAELAAEIMTRLKFSNPMIQRVTNLIVHHMDVVGYDTGWSDGALRRLIRRVGPENIEDFFAFRRADLLAHGLKNKEKLDLLNELAKRVEGMMKSPIALESGDLAIGGHEVMKVLGIGEGPEVGKVLHVLIERVVDQPQLNTKEALLALVRDMKKA